MKRNREDIDRLERRLFQAHRERPLVELPPDWQANLMRDIRHRAMERESNGTANRVANAFAGLLLRFAGAGAFAAAGMLLYVYNYGPDLGSQAADLAMEYPVAIQALERFLFT